MILRGVSFFDTKLRITQRNLNKNRIFLTHWSVAQAGLNEDKTGGRKSRWTVPLMKSDFVLFYIWYEYVPKGII